MQDWDRNDQGNVALCPLIGYQTAVAAMTGMLRIAYARDEAEFEAGGTTLQLSMTPVQLRTLSAALRQMADRIDKQNLAAKQ